ncbi:MAG: hypothetical protein HY680_04080 [Chloroflexi bacterium]|nr:hypothetical protein [Chloroflexota bacterium]
MFDPDDFWQLVQALVATPTPSEAASRTAASRAYYALYLTVRERLGLPTAGEAADHGRVLAELRNRGRWRLAQAMGSLRRLRNQADYDLDTSITRSIVADAISHTESYYQSAKRL